MSQRVVPPVDDGVMAEDNKGHSSVISAVNIWADGDDLEV